MWIENLADVCVLTVSFIAEHFLNLSPHARERGRWKRGAHVERGVPWVYKEFVLMLELGPDIKRYLGF